LSSIYGRKRSEFRADFYEINGKRVLVQRIPGPSDFWHDATPAQQFWTVIIIAVIIIGYSIMNCFDLSFGTSIASEEQLRWGMSANMEARTGPHKDYFGEATDLVKSEALKREARLNNTDQIVTEWHPEYYPSKYSQMPNVRAGYVGNNRFYSCFYYVVRNGSKQERLYGYGIVKLYQSSTPVGYFVKQVWTIEELKIVYRE